MNLRLHLAESGADTERLDQVTRYLREELLELDVHAVTALPSGPPPPGSRALDVATVGGLLVTLGQSATALQTIVAAVQNWLRRGTPVPRAVRVEIDGDVLELSDATGEEQERLVALFVGRHA